jgi:hypothetical protein
VKTNVTPCSTAPGQAAAGAATVARRSATGEPRPSLRAAEQGTPLSRAEEERDAANLSVPSRPCASCGPSSSASRRRMATCAGK